MLKIEVIKFEAMDVITASTPKVEDTVECICPGDDHRIYDGVHHVGNDICPYPHGEGDCEVN